MTSMGKPQVRNSFANIKMAPQQNTNISKGELLNKISGRKDGGRFVDAKNHNKLGKNEFMKLLTHQLSNQDPLNPMDQKKFAADLAQFSQLEQLANMNSKLEALGGNKSAENKFIAASFLGKKVLTKGTTIELKQPGEKKDLSFFMPKHAKEAVVRVLDNQGQTVKQINLKDLSRGKHQIIWDGVQNDNTTAAKGTYTIQVYAWDQNLTPFEGETKSSGIVTNVDFEDGEAILTLDRQKRITLRDVESFEIVGQNNSKDNVLKKEQALKQYAQGMQ